MLIYNKDICENSVRNWGLLVGGAFGVEVGADMQSDSSDEADALTTDEKNAILSDPKWGFEKRGGISIVSASGQKVDGRFLAFVEGKETLASGGEKTTRDVLSTSALHEQMHGVVAIMRKAAKNGNAESQPRKGVATGRRRRGVAMAARRAGGG